MNPKFRVWIKEEKCFADYIESIRYYSKEIDLCWGGICESDCFGFEDVIFMQSTGLFDKNGKEIFEGDIVRMRNPRDRRQIGMFQVVRVANSPMLGLLDKKLTTEIFNLYEHMRNYYEIIGNIYENPELLEVEE